MNATCKAYITLDVMYTVLGEVVEKN